MMELRLNRRRIRGAALLESVTAAFMGTMVLTTAFMIYMSGMMSWTKGEARITAEDTATVAVRRMSVMLREAMYVAVDNNGMGLTFRWPIKESNGRFRTPPVWDGITRRMYVQNGILYVSDGTNTEAICKGIITTDPQSAGGAAAYTVFTPGQGTNTRQVTLMLVTQSASYRTEQVTSRCRETIFVRNVPEITR